MASSSLPQALSGLSVSISSDNRDDPPDAYGAKLSAGEAGGAGRVWLANHLFQRDPITRAAFALSSTPRLGVALMAMNPFTIHPVQLAMAAATLDEFHPGRVTLCLGSGSPGDLDTLSLSHSKPLKPMQEALEICRALLSGEKVRYEGEVYKVHDRLLATGRRPVPIYLAASRPRMLELAGSHADGVLISGGASVEFVRWSLEHVQRGAAGRTVRAGSLVYAATADDAAAVGRLRRLLAMLLRHPHHQHNMDVAGTVIDQQQLSAAVKAGDWASADAMITDAVVDRHAIVGDPAHVRERLAAYRAAGLDEVVLAATRDGEQIGKLLACTRAG
ncbi:MAG: LLM class flavin-dependent oxidoreductase [Proteobacteria bacterium]|nr:LLM class flavin-dependent oxidoreductase [Pseudomonadota bacterium]